MKIVPTQKLTVSIVAALAGLSSLTLNAQAPARGQAAAPAAGAPARGAAARGAAAAPAAPAAPALNAAQRAAISDIQVPPELQTAATAAVTALTTAAFTLPADPAKLRTLSDAVAKAELDLANGRLAAIAKANEALVKITGPQAQAVFGGRGRGAGNPGQDAAKVSAAAAFKDNTGFVPIFDGKTLTGWDGESDVWTVSPAPESVGGSLSIHSDNSPGHTTGQHHIHYVGANGISPIVKDFELKVEFHIEGGNAGIHYRSRLLQGHGPNRAIADPATIADPLGAPLPAGITTQAAANAAGISGQPWQVSGYQFDITGNGTGNLYEGQGRSTVGNVGEMIILNPGTPNHVVVAQTMDNAYATYGRPDGWNEAWIIARGGTLFHLLNGRVFMVAVDDDQTRRAMSGIISLQLEGTGQVWYRSVRLKHLP